MSTTNTNTGITLVDVRHEAMDAIKLLKQGKIDLKQAAVIKDLCNTVISVAKVQVEYVKAVPKHIKDQMTINEVKAIAGTLIDRDADLDVSLKQIEESKKKPYQIGG